MDPTKEPEQYLTFDYDHIAKKCLFHNKSKIDALPGVENYFIGLSSGSSERKPVIVINSSLQGGGEYPDALSVPLDSGEIFLVPVEVVYGFDLPNIQLASGDNICHVLTAAVSGTICCNVIKDNKKYLLTCAHVLTGGLPNITPENNNGWFVNPEIDDTLSADENFTSVGTWCYGVIDKEIDVALIQTEFEITPVVNINVYPPEYRTGFNHKEVFVNGEINKRGGYIVGFTENETKFSYNGIIHKLSNLILLSRNKTSSPVTLTESGDSGAIVYMSQDKTAFGMVVGGNKLYTYAIPLHTILTNTQTKLI